MRGGVAGMIVAEALAARPPAIVTKGAHCEGLAKQVACRWIDIGLEPLIAFLDEALACPTQCVSRNGNERSQIEYEYSWTHIGKKMTGTYNWILNGGKTPDWII